MLPVRNRKIFIAFMISSLLIQQKNGWNMKITLKAIYHHFNILAYPIHQTDRLKLMFSKIPTPIIIVKIDEPP
jgi:hypothetical protein